MRFASHQVMQSRMIDMLMPSGASGAALLVRRADGQFALERIDARVARAARVAARLLRQSLGAADTGPGASTVGGLKEI